MKVNIKKIGSVYNYGESTIVNDDVLYQTDSYQVELFGKTYDFSTTNKGEEPIKRFIAEKILELSMENNIGIPDKDFIIDNPEMFEKPFDFREVPENQKEYFISDWIWVIKKNITLEWR